MLHGGHLRMSTHVEDSEGRRGGACRRKEEGGDDDEDAPT